MLEPAKFVQVETGSSPENCVIWLHGLGADGYDFLPIVKELQKLGVPTTRYVFPHAPQIPVSINGGYVMRAWYDIKNVDLQRQEDESGIIESSTSILSLIEEQIKQGFSPESIVLAGFSQGAAIAYYAGLRCEHKLGGIIALSGYLPMPENLKDEMSVANAKTPIFAAHGANDHIVPCLRGELAVTTLQSLDYSVQWQTYPVEHTVCADEVGDISAFLKAVFA